MSEFCGIININKKAKLNMCDIVKKMSNKFLESNQFIVKEFESSVVGCFNHDCYKTDLGFAILNGEIYNQQYLNKLLLERKISIDTNSCVELLFKAYQEFGVEIFKKIEGLFVAFIYDNNSKEFLIVRDRVGGVPIYYTKKDEYFIFASSLKMLLSSGIIKKEINREALSQFLQLTYIPSPLCIISNVSKLNQASVLKFSNEKFQVLEYHNLDYKTKNIITDYKEAKNILIDSMYNAVKIRMRDGAGAFLSGGFDSSIVVGVMSRVSDKPIDTFTIAFKEKGFNESPLASLVSKRNNTNHHVIELTDEIIDETIFNILNENDEPYADSSLIASCVVAKEAKKYVEAVLTGDGGDELFAGYNKYLIGYYNKKFNNIPQFIRKGIIKPCAKLLSKQSYLSIKVNKFLSVVDKDDFTQRKELMSLGFKDYELKQLMLDGFVDKMDFIEKTYNYLVEADEQTKTQYVDYKVVLEGDMLAKSYNSTRLSNLSIRPPLLDANIVDFAYNIPTKFKIDGKKRKIILKDAFNDILPKELYNAPKHGFGVPMQVWITTKLKEKILKLIDKDFLEAQGLFDYEYINKTIQNHINGKENRYSELWAFYVFQNWYKENIM